MANCRKPSRRAFTLIELLIVVAIIAILAAIAVPNFLEAQTRAKVSRVKADMRSCATALESYAVDDNHYPYEQLDDRFPHRLTTPVAYLSSVPLDIFRVSAPGEEATPYADRSFRYYRLMPPEEESRPDVLPFRAHDADYESDEATLNRYGRWAFSSFGPDQDLDNLWQFVFSDPTTRLYDPTNGTVSNGDLARTQKQRENAG
jgi:prepilin-type N-terminal cleavage/methylation domain-containing protein